MDNKKIRFIGRHIKKNGYEYFSYSGCGFECIVKPQSGPITISLISELRDHDKQYVSIYVNDEFIFKPELGSGEQKITIKVDENKPSLVKLIKENETYLSALYLKDISGELLDVEPSNRPLIGFFGDSITCGYGTVDFHGADFCMKGEEFTKTYAFLASNALKMDYSVVARSGISIKLPIYCDLIFSEIYDTVDMYEKCPLDRKLDYAVINLGTNDNGAYAILKEEDKPNALNEFKKAYVEFIKRLIKDNPNIKIVMVYNTLVLLEEIETAIKEVREKIHKEYKAIKLLKMVHNSDGGNGHPYMTGHKENSDLLVRAIRDFK